MPINFTPLFQITPSIARDLMRIEAAKQKISLFPVDQKVLANLKEKIKLYRIHFSTLIEGNILELYQIKEILTLKANSPGGNSDEQEVKGYYAALTQLEQYQIQNQPVTQEVIKILQALVISDGNLGLTPHSHQDHQNSTKSKTINIISNGHINVRPAPYRDSQNLIKDSATGVIIYRPPEPNEVPELMKSLINWINESNNLPCPIIAAISHYQFITIHPYYEANGRTARLLTTLILHLGGYDLMGLYYLEEYYAANPLAYYQAISLGPIYNNYSARKDSDITSWVEYFIQGMAEAFEKAFNKMIDLQNKEDKDHLVALIRTLNTRQRLALELFQNYEFVTSNQIGELFGLKPRTNTALCKRWVEGGFLEIVDPSNKARKYKLAKAYEVLIGDFNSDDDS